MVTSAALIPGILFMSSRVTELHGSVPCIAADQHKDVQRMAIAAICVSCLSCQLKT